MGNRNSSQQNSTVINKNHPVLRIKVLGLRYVGKTCLVRTYESGVFEENNRVRIGVDIYFKIIKVHNKSAELQIWNIAEYEMCFDSMMARHVSHADGILLLFDVTNIYTFQFLPQVVETIQKVNPRTVTFIVGAKCDLLEKREISSKAAKIFARSRKLEYFECSAKTGKNVKKVFGHMALRILQKQGFIPSHITEIDETEMVGKSLEWKGTKEVPNVSVSADEIPSASVTKNILHTSVTQGGTPKYKQQVVPDHTISKIQKEGKSIPELKSSCSQVGSVDDMKELFQSIGKNKQAVEQGSLTSKTPSSPAKDEILQSGDEDGNVLVKRDDDVSYLAKGEVVSDVNESYNSLEEENCVVVKERKPVVLEEEILLEGKCPSWFG